MSKNLSNQRGFTLVELLVAIVIIVILSVIGIASFNTANTRNDLQNQAKEIVSQMRKIRTDSVAASKPTTNATDPTLSCKSPTAVSDVGVLYGTYITFTSSDYITGVSCWTPSSVNVGGTPTSTTLRDGTAASPGSTFFFSFNGSVYQPSGANLLAGVPTEAFVKNPTTPLGAGASRITLTKGSQNFYIYVNGAGLICAEKNSATTCAQ